ncbi:[protein-PII] uridylyltransferase [Aeromicrobium phragmitis]|uniref:Bifunctional uridylyltransferase/uridylyl-removing enzyme n=1 Tax=Aeromicrobium phragmitis TaxID=2478914 RepID=A0A3L8PSI2_9ACTN|nr:[protein-PII] uridylyltransferase [Aeromicrobium phragmitis]RLV56942.1 [protein-PII] uridylyltransferase [Aeromicrobium phragmitis]
MGRPGRLGRAGPHRRDGRGSSLTELLGSSDLSTRLAQQRRDRSDEADRLLRQLFVEATGSADTGGLAIVAIGGYGRQELSPFSDLDVVLLHDPAAAPSYVADAANAIWYPLWDRRIDLDHAVRSTREMLARAEEDHRAAMGMLDARSVAGDPTLVRRVRADALARWRRRARERVTEVRSARAARIERAGWLAHDAVPDLKESGGGLRDSVTLRALLATWLVDLPRAEAELLRTRLLDVRDTVHEVAGRRTDKLIPELVPELAHRWSLTPTEFDVGVRDLGRRTAHLAAVTWHRLDESLERDRHRRIGRRGPRIESQAPGVGVLDREVVVTRDADPHEDPEVLLRFAATAARLRLPMNAAAVARLARDLGPLPEPWPETTRRWFVELLSAGRGAVEVWEELDIAGLVDRFLPEWSDIRLRGSSSPVHRFTIDRHSLEACVQADELNRQVARPDLLAVAALLHDIGKGRPGDHSEVGAAMAEHIVRRWGFSADEADVVSRLVRWHLLLPTVATGRDIEDPRTAANVAEIVQSSSFLDLLAALTACDAMATSEQAWSGWRRGLVLGLVEKVRSVLAGTDDDRAQYEGWPPERPLPDLTGVTGGTIRVSSENHHDGSLVTIVSVDRPGLLADLAGALATAGLSIRSARIVTVDDVAVTLWEVSRPDLDPHVLHQRIRRVLDGTVDLAARLFAVDDQPRVSVLDVMEQTATLIEVRALDRRGLMWTVARTIADGGHQIRSAHTSTYGDEARDVFYVVDAHGFPLSADAAGELCAAVHTALTS